MYDSIGNKRKHAVWLDQQSQRYAIQHLSLREETQHSCIKCCMDCFATIVDFLNNRSLSCAKISDILAEHLTINRCEQEIVPA